MDRLEQAAINLGKVQVELRRRRYYQRRWYVGRNGTAGPEGTDIAIYRHGWSSMDVCPRCFFRKMRTSTLCFLCASDQRRNDPGWRGPFP